MSRMYDRHCLPFLDCLELLRGKVGRLGLLDRGEGLAGLDRPGQRWRRRRRWILDGGDRSGREGPMVRRSDGALLRDVLDARRGARRELPLPLHCWSSAVQRRRDWMAIAGEPCVVVYRASLYLRVSGMEGGRSEMLQTSRRRSGRDGARCEEADWEVFGRGSRGDP